MIIDLAIGLIALGIVVAMASVCVLIIGLLAIGLEALIIVASKTWRPGPKGRKDDAAQAARSAVAQKTVNPRSGD
jgi:hypothetical protein